MTTNKINKIKEKSNRTTKRRGKFTGTFVVKIPLPSDGTLADSTTILKTLSLKLQPNFNGGKRKIKRIKMKKMMNWMMMEYGFYRF